ncbi:MAG: 4'-phosphopantetheinyl transferase superfamily protein [Verrucomicrobiota bacterium]
MIETVGIRDVVGRRDELVGQLTLREGVIDLWLVYLGPDKEARALCLEELDGRERERAARYVVEPPRHQYVLTQGALRMILRGYLGEEAYAGMTYGRGEKGKPYVMLSGKRCDVEFNVSHSGDYALMGFSKGGEVGVDVEGHRKMRDALDVGARVYSDAELSYLRSLNEDDRKRAFFRLWTCKEAVLKAEGLGLAGKPKTWCLFSGEPPVEGGSMANRYRVKGWDIEWVDFGPGYSMAWVARPGTATNWELGMKT